MSQSPPEQSAITYFNCLPCKNLHTKCTREKPTCSRCAKTGSECIYPANPDPRIPVPKSHLESIERLYEQLMRTVQELQTEVKELKSEIEELGSEVRVLKNNNTSNVSQSRHVADVPQLLQPPNDFDNINVHQTIITRLPPLKEARKLINAVLAFIGPDYHLISRNSFLSTVEKTYKLKRNPYPADQTWYCRIFAVFALGELYTLPPKSTDENEVPGCAYFEYAMKLFQELYEEPTIEYIETILLVAFYEYALNNRNSAFVRAGLALRLSLTLRLHRKPPEDCSPRERAHRVRVWWTVYILDRISSSKVRLPATIRDEDIDTPEPSLVGFTESDIEDYYGRDHEIFVLQGQLAKITGDLLSALYRTTRLDHTNDFLQEFRKVVLQLTTWRQSLSASLEFNSKVDPPYSSRSVASLHLNFSQCVMLATRPIFFYIFAFRTESTIRQSAEYLPALLPGSEEFSEKCVNAARQSSSILMRLKKYGHLAIYGYFDAHAVFSSALILMMSSIIQFSAVSGDSKRIEALGKILQEMRDAGNMSASGYYRELVECKNRLQKIREKMDRASNPPDAMTGGIDGVEHLHINASGYDQTDIADFYDVDTDTLLQGLKLQALLQDPKMSWEDSFPHVFSNGDGTFRNYYNTGPSDFLESNFINTASPEDHGLSSTFHY